MTKQVLQDAAWATNLDGSSQGWVRSPYGVRIQEDPDAAFKNLMEIENFVMGQDGSDEGAKMNVQQWTQLLDNADQSGALNRTGDNGGMVGGKSIYSMPNYTDTRVGGNDAINPYWQFNRDDDIVPTLFRMPGMEAFSSGMGRVYAEMYDDNQEILWMRMGVPEFVNVISFYAGTGDANAAKVMNQGSIRTLVGKILKFVVSTAVWAITFPVLAPFHIAKWVDHFNSERITQYYYFKPAMSLYYEMVNTMMSYLAVGMGMYPMWWLRRWDPAKSQQNGQFESDYAINQPGNGPNTNKPGYPSSSLTAGDIETASKQGYFSTNDSGIPELLKGGPDIFVILNRRARLFNAQRVEVTTRQLLAEQHKSQQKASNFYVTPSQKFNRNKDGSFEQIQDDEKTGTFSSAFEALKGTMFGAGDFVGFRIERGVNCTESVSNQTGPTGISQKLNQIAQKKRDEFEDSGGGSFIGKIANALWNKESPETFLKNVGVQLAANAASAFGVGDIGAILANGSGYVDIPEIWKNSSFNKSYSFNVQLRARYGDTTSIFQSVYIPLLMLLCAALPRSIGDNMYTSPFIINAYCKGKFAVPCGMITDMTITRGKDEFGWNCNNLPTAVDVSFSIKDLSPALFLSMADIGFFDTFSRNNSLMEYLDTMAGLGLSERLYFWPKVMRKLTTACLIKKNTIFSPTYWGSKIGRSPGVRFLAAFLPYGNNETSDFSKNAGTNQTVSMFQAAGRVGRNTMDAIVQ